MYYEKVPKHEKYYQKRKVRYADEQLKRSERQRELFRQEAEKERLQIIQETALR